MNPIIVAFGAVARRFAVALGTGLLAIAVPYLSDAWRPALEEALKDSALPGVVGTTLWLVIEFGQKFYREEKKAKKAKKV